jgi:two-component sensor histidine kinase
MTRFIIIAVFLLTAAITSGQTVVKSNLSKQEASHLLNSLSKKIADTNRIDILLRLAEYNLEKESYEQVDLDSAASFIRHAKEINARQISGKRDDVILLYESTLIRKGGNREAARQLVNRAIRQLKISNDEFHLLQAYLELSRCYDPKVPEQATAIKDVFNALFQRVPKQIRHEQLDTCMLELINFYNLKMEGDGYLIQLDFLGHLIRTYQILKDQVNVFWARKEMADIHYKQGKLNVAINELLQIAKEQKAGNYPGICFTYDLLSGLYGAGADLDKALHYSLETVKNVSSATDSFYLTNFYARIAANYSKTGSTAEAVDWNLKRLNYLIEVKRTGFIYGTIFNITSDLIKLRRPWEALDMILDKSNTIVPSNNWEKSSMLLCLAMCYAAVNKYTIAEKYCQELIKLSELRIKRKEIPHDPGTDQFLATFYLEVGQYEKAEKYFKKVLDVQPKSDHSRELNRNGFFFKLDSARGHYFSAIKHLQAYQTIHDSIFTATKSKQIEELKIAYATEQKDQLINLNEQNIQLLTKQDQLQKSKLQQGAILRNISFAVLALLIIIMALLYNRYRLKQRSNRKLQLQQQEIAQQNSSLQHLVDEKEWLLKEIHHRVKNNLQIVMSLLNSQSAFIDNDAALTAIHDSQHRVHAMSLIHQKLYNSDNVSSINMSFYISELVSYLADSFNTGQRIRFELNIEPLEIDVSQAVPLGLVLNEAITNAIKYAFPGGRSGVIAVSLASTTPHHYLLTISDNGIGIPPQFNNRKPGSLGMTLMAGLSEDLDGHFSIENKNGTTITISFVTDQSVKRPNALAANIAS